MSELDADTIAQLIRERDEANARADRAETILYGQPMRELLREKREKKWEEERLRKLEKERARPL